MRLRLIPPDKLSAEQKPLYDAFRTQIDSGFNAFKTLGDDGALLGPWSVWIQEPKVGEAMRVFLDAVSTMGRLSDEVKQIAILAVGSRYKAAYEMYAHAAVGGRDGLSADKMAAVCAGQRPSDLTREEATAFDVAMALLDGGVLAAPTYHAAREEMGQPALNELIQIVGLYSLVSITLNAYDVPTELLDD